MTPSAPSPKVVYKQTPAKTIIKTITVESPSCKIAKAENLTYEDIVDNDNDELTLIAGFFENMTFYLENPTATHKIAKKLAYFTLNRESLLKRIKNQK